MKKEYRWKDLSNDGLLKEPDNIGPYYDEKSPNPHYGNYESEEEALEGLQVFFKGIRDKYYTPCYEYVLVTIYSNREGE